MKFSIPFLFLLFLLTPIALSAQSSLPITLSVRGIYFSLSPSSKTYSLFPGERLNDSFSIRAECVDISDINVTVNFSVSDILSPFIQLLKSSEVLGCDESSLIDFSIFVRSDTTPSTFSGKIFGKSEDQREWIDILIEVKCKPDGYSCSFASECCGGFCCNGKCSSSACEERVGVVQFFPIFYYPNMSVDAPEEIVVYVNESSSFLIRVKNTGNLTLRNISVETPLIETISFNITPEFYERLDVGESKIFVVGLISREVGVVNVSFRIKSDRISVERWIKIITIEKKPPVNITSFMEKVNALRKMLNSTFEILREMKSQGYEVSDLEETLNFASSLVGKSIKLFNEGKYEEAEETFSEAYELTQQVILKLYALAKKRSLLYEKYQKVILILIGIILLLISLLIVKVFLH